MNDALLNLAWRALPQSSRPGRGLLVVTAHGGHRIAALIRRVRDRYPRVNVFQLADHAVRPIAGTIPVPAPPPRPRLVRRWLRQLKLQAAVAEPEAPAGLLTLIRDQGVGVITVDAEGIHAALERLSAMLATPRPPAKRAAGVEALLLAGLERPPLSWTASGKFTALESLGALSEALGRPRSILCLGNGPSSEDPALRDTSFDALFRVNHRWTGARHHTAPQVVFTGNKQTLRVCTRAGAGMVIYGFMDDEAARRIMLRTMLLPCRCRYFTAEALGCLNAADFAPYQPTNGALMVAVAAALRPEELTVAGVDLFSDPRGPYPESGDVPNAYAAPHDRETEARCILHTLAAFPGRVTVIGDVLAAQWRHLREGTTARPGGN